MEIARIFIREYTSNWINLSRIVNLVFKPFELTFWILALPVRGLAWIIFFVRTRDPVVSPKTKCPACGYRGSRLNFVATKGIEKAAIQHDCLMCGAKFYSQLLVKAEKWWIQNNQQR